MSVGENERKGGERRPFDFLGRNFFIPPLSPISPISPGFMHLRREREREKSDNIVRLNVSGDGESD